MSKTEVLEILESTRQEQLEKFGELDDLCVYNATQLYQNLSENGYECDVIRGGLDMPNRETPETEDDLAQTGTGHWWTEVFVDEKRYTADIYAIGPEFDGEIILLSEVPSSYIPITRNPEHMYSYISSSL